MPDAYVKRTADDFAAALSNLLPTGPAWSRDPAGPLMQFVGGIAGIWGDVSQRSDDLLVRESDPRATFEMLPDWERAFGLPDPCLAEPLTIGDRQKALVAKMTTQGGQSRQFFIAAAATLGYDIDIGEFAPYMCGISRCGDTRDPAGLVSLLLRDGSHLLLRTGGQISIFPPNTQWRWELGPAEIRFYWTVKVAAVRLTWFRVGDGGGQTGVDPHLRISLATDLECVLRRWKPAHTDIVFDYSGRGIPDPMAGTP